MTVRAKLLESIDSTFDDFSDEMLVDILLDQIKRAKAALFEAQQAVIKEGTRVNDIEKSCREEIHRAKNDPTYGVAGIYYFVGLPGQPTYILTINGRDIQLVRRQNRIDYALHHVTAQEYARHNP